MKASIFIDWLKEQIGTAEDPIGSNNVRYNTIYYGHPVSGSSYPWCMAFVWCGFKEIGASNIFMQGGKTASCTTLYKWAKQHNQWVTSDYAMGDVFIFSEDGTANGIYHTGVYTGQKTSNGRYITIEGNVSDKVMYVYRSDKEVFGAYRPKWEAEEQPAPSTKILCKVEVPEASYGDVGITVKRMQSCLVSAGYSLPRYGADGEFGAETRNALIAFQQDNNLGDDGICGAKTWTKLLNG